MKSHFETKPERHEVGRRLSLLLRELAPKQGIAIDEYGFAPLDAVVAKMKDFKTYLCLEHILEIAAKDPQQRFEVSANKIRARAGHRFPVSVPSEAIAPPEFLYHGTCEEAVPEISKKGILKMGKAFVHLASTPERAARIGLRKSQQPVILRVKALRANEAGVRFWQSGQVSSDGEILLSDEVPPQFVERFDG